VAAAALAAVMGLLVWRALEQPGDPAVQPAPLVQSTVADATLPLVDGPFGQASGLPIPAPIEVPADPSPADSSTTARVAGAPEARRGLTVVVVDGSGRTVAGATVEAFLDTALEGWEVVAGHVAERHGLDAAEARAQVRETRRNVQESEPTWDDPVARAVTDVEGSAWISMPTEAVLLVAEHGQLGCSGVVSLRAAGEPGGAVAQLTLKVLPRGVLHGLVLDEGGQPAADARVVFGRLPIPNEELGRPRIPRPIQAGPDGRFVVPVDNDFVARVHAEFQGRTSFEESVFVFDGRGQDIELRLPGAFAVTGVVVGPDGAPVPNATVGAAGRKVAVDDTTSDTEGRFRLRLAKPGHVTVSATSQGLLPAGRSASTWMTNGRSRRS